MVDFETWYTGIPIITRTYLTLSTLTSFAVTFELVTPLQLYLNYTTIWKNYHVWRVLTTFLYFDRLSINFILHIYFLYFYCRRLEEHSFHRKSADFLYMILFGIVCMLFIAPMLQLPFMSHALVVMLLYVWSRRNPHEQLRLYGLFTVGAGYLSYVLLLLSLFMGMSPVVDLVGIFVGHVYFFFKHVIVAEYGEQYDVLRTPWFMKKLFARDDYTVDDEDNVIPHDDDVLHDDHDNYEDDDHDAVDNQHQNQFNQFENDDDEIATSNQQDHNNNQASSSSSELQTESADEQIVEEKPLTADELRQRRLNFLQRNKQQQES